MKNLVSKILLVLYILLPLYSAKALNFEEFSKGVVTDIQADPGHTSLMYLWQQVLQNGYYDAGPDNEKTRSEVTKLQAIIELHLSKLPRGDAKAYIIAPMPPTPLRMIGLANPFCDDGKTLCPSFFRTNTLRKFIGAGHDLNVLYSIDGYEVQGVDLFRKTLENNPNVVSSLVNSIPDDMQGATYYFKFDNDKYLFSLEGSQRGSTGNNNWQIWFGQQDTENNLERTKKVLYFVEPLISIR